LTVPRVLKRPLAYADLAEIWSFIADDSEDAADRFFAVLEQKFGMLATQPLMGRLRTELVTDLRSFPVGRYVVFYRPMPDGINLLRVLHGARDIGVHDFEDDDHE
jgi:toxin ParE1/3/4